jgi:hypothetical protein
MLLQLCEASTPTADSRQAALAAIHEAELQQLLTYALMYLHRSVVWEVSAGTGAALCEVSACTGAALCEAGWTLAGCRSEVAQWCLQPPAAEACAGAERARGGSGD